MNNPMCREYVNTGNLSGAFKLYTQNQGAPVQLTMIFNIFVLYTLFNQFNFRVVDGIKIFLPELEIILFLLLLKFSNSWFNLSLLNIGMLSSKQLKMDLLVNNGQFA